MSNHKAIIKKVNIIARNFEQTLKFYRLLGLEIPTVTTEPPETLHASADNTDGMSFSIDNEKLASIYNAGWRSKTYQSSVLLTVSLSSRSEVDANYNRLISAGYTGLQPAYDAFWGARYAIVADPEGNAVGLESPIDEDKRTWPPVKSPSP